MPETATPGFLQIATRWIGSHFRRGQNHVLPTVDIWNAQYESGRWTYLGRLSELSRYSVLVGYMVHFKPGGAVLDVGCGEGILLVSICTAFKGGTAILERLKEVYAVLDETRVTHADNQWSWICVALAR